MLFIINQDPRDYFDAQQANALKSLDDTRAGTEQMKCSLTTEEAYSSLRKTISKIKTGEFNDPTVRPEVALMVIEIIVSGFIMLYLLRCKEICVFVVIYMFLW